MELDKFLEDFTEFDCNFTRSIQQIMTEVVNVVGNGVLRGKWEIRQIDRSGIKGYTVQGRITSDQPSAPFDPSNPFEPWEPIRRRPMPKRRFEPMKDLFGNQSETLVDVYDEKDSVRVYR